MKPLLEEFVNLNYWAGDFLALKSAILNLLAAGKSAQLVTINAEMLVWGRDKREFGQLLRQAEFLVVDSHAVYWWLKLMRRPALYFPGIDLAEALMLDGLAPVALVGGYHQTAARAAAKLAKEKVVVVLAVAGPKIGDGFASEDFVAKINASQPKLILVGMGHGKQEFWTQAARAHVTGAALWMGVGGAFDVWAGNLPRASQRWRTFGLEWLWRLCREPRRYGRIFSAVIIFPILAIATSLINWLKKLRT